MELRHLQYFIALAEELSFTRAARRLHISQPPLSMQIRNLEEELGVTLFDRDRRNVALTAAGERFLREARQIVDHVDRAVRVAREAGRGFAGTITLAINPSLDLLLLPRLLRRTGEELPGVEVCLRQLSHREQIEALAQGTVDVGFLRPPLEERDRRGLVVETLMQEALLLAIPADHALARRKSVPLGKLAGENCILWQRAVAPGSYDAVLAACQAAQFCPRIAYEAEAIQTALGLVSGGLGIAFVPESTRVLSREGVVYTRITGNPVMLELSLVWRRDNGSPILPHLLRLAKEVARYPTGA